MKIVNNATGQEAVLKQCDIDALAKCSGLQPADKGDKTPPQTAPNEQKPEMER